MEVQKHTVCMSVKIIHITISCTDENIVLERELKMTLLWKVPPPANIS